MSDGPWRGLKASWSEKKAAECFELASSSDAEAQEKFDYAVTKKVMDQGFAECIGGIDALLDSNPTPDLFLQSPHQVSEMLFQDVATPFSIDVALRLPGLLQSGMTILQARDLAIEQSIQMSAYETARGMQEHYLKEGKAEEFQRIKTRSVAACETLNAREIGIELRNNNGKALSKPKKDTSLDSGPPSLGVRS